jgi:hypothetical protein
LITDVKKRRNLIILVLLIAFVLRLGLALSVTHPGHGDFAFYTTLAENIAAGRGFVIDYIWHYLTKTTSITHGATDFWMPMASIIISGFMILFGKSLLMALLPSILFGLGLSVLVYLWSRYFSESEFVSLAAAGLALFLPMLFTFSLLTDSTIYYVFFVTACFLFLAKAQAKSSYFLLAAVFAGLSHLTRQDGLFLVPVILLMILLSSLKWPKKVWLVVGAIVIYLAILSPIWITNLQIYGQPLPPGPNKTMFIIAPEDVNSYARVFNWQTYSAWGLGNIIRAKIQTGLNNIKTLYDTAGSLVLILSLVGLVELALNKSRRSRWRPYLPPVLFGAIIYLFYSVIASIPSAGGAFGKSILSICPFMVIVACEVVDRHFALRKIAVIVIVLSGLFFMGHGIFLSGKLISSNNRLSRQLNEVKIFLDTQLSSGQETIIMTRNPWEVYYSTHYRAIQIPDDDLETIYEVASRYKANYLLLPAPRLALKDIYTGSAPDPRFEKVADIPESEMKLFRIK